MKFFIILLLATPVAFNSLLFMSSYSYAQDGLEDEDFEEFDDEFEAEEESEEDAVEEDVVEEDAVEEDADDEFFADEDVEEELDAVDELEGEEEDVDDEFFAVEEDAVEEDVVEEEELEEGIAELEGEDGAEVAEEEEIEALELSLDEGEEDQIDLQEKVVEETIEEKKEDEDIDAPSMVYANDEPDLQYEAQVHDIIMQYHSTPMTDKDWDYIVGAKISEAYTIQKGDTLWDMSKTFFGDGNYWPKIWSVNSKIKNPHLIEPSNVIRFILGNENDAPMFAITEKTEDVEAEEEGLEQSLEATDLEAAKLSELELGISELEKELEEEFSEAELEEELLSDEEIEGVIIPPPEQVVRPVTQVFPPSLPKWKSFYETYLESKVINFEKEIKTAKPTQNVLSYYIDENHVESEGKVVGVEGGGVIASQFQHIHVRIKKGWAKRGDRFLITANMGPLRTLEGVQEDAIIWEVQGRIVIKDKLKATKKYASENFEIFSAYIDNALSTITKGADLFKEDYTFIDDSREGRVPKASGMIIGGPYDNKRNLLSKESIAFINLGEKEGLQSGDILPIYSNNYIEQVDPYVLTSKKPMGVIKVIKTSELYSTGYILENNGSINIGDFVGLKNGFEKEFLGANSHIKTLDGSSDSEYNQELKEVQALLEDQMGDENLTEESVSDDDFNFEYNEE